MDLKTKNLEKPGAKLYQVFDLPEKQRLETFQLPPELEAHEPPEARGLTRDQVRLMVSYRSKQAVTHSRFKSLPDFLQPGDVLVINTSRTINAAIDARREDGSEVEVHFSTHLPSGHWVVELRTLGINGSEPLFTAHPGEKLILPLGAYLTLQSNYQGISKSAGQDGHLRVRLWIAKVETPQPVVDYLSVNGFPIQYKHVWGRWPLSYFQTVYADEPGSAEMPSAGRAFSVAVLNKLRAKGVIIAPLVLHTGVASVEENEFPPDEYYRIPQETAEAVNRAHQEEKRVIAVGTTVIRALETVVDPEKRIHPGEGWTSLFITPRRKVSAVDGLLTGFHEPRSTHLLMLTALAGKEHIQRSYQEALQERYLWHEFGDLHLILP